MVHIHIITGDSVLGKACTRSALSVTLLYFDQRIWSWQHSRFLVAVVMIVRNSAIWLSWTFTEPWYCITWLMSMAANTAECSSVSMHSQSMLGTASFFQFRSLIPPFELNELQQFQHLIYNMPWFTLHTWLFAPACSQDFANEAVQHLKLYRIRVCASHHTAGH